MEAAAAVELLILSISETFVYRIPTLKSSAGHRAEDWQLDAPAFTGVTRVYQRGDDLAVRLYRFRDAGSTLTTDDNLELFAECAIHLEKDDALSKFVDEVVDSSRYFVLRCKDPNSSRVATVGIGFRERQTATDFRGVLLEHVKFLRRQAAAISGVHEGEGDEEDEDGNGVSAASAFPAVDLSLHEGQKIRINLKSKRKTDAAVDAAATGATEAAATAATSSTTRVSTAAAGPNSAFGLRPPPPAPAPEPTEDDWGDFETA